MQELIAVLVAAFVGIVVGYWLRSLAAKAEKTQFESRSMELTRELGSVRLELTLAQAETGARAGFEVLAGERLASVERLAAERDELQRRLAAIARVELDQAATISR